MWFRSPSASDLVHVAGNMREMDRREVFALREAEDPVTLAYQLYAHLPRAQIALVAGIDNFPMAVAFLGIWAMDESGGLASANLFATADFPHIAPALVRLVRRSIIPTLLTRGCRRVECRVLAHHRNARRFIRACGAAEEVEMADYGKAREPFILCAWTRTALETPHVREPVRHAQHPEGSDRAAR